MTHDLRLLALLAVVTVIALQLPVVRAQSAEQPSQHSATSAPSHAATGGPGRAVLAQEGVNVPQPTTCPSVGSGDTWLHYGTVQVLTSVIVVVDGRQTKKIKVGQLADYLAMVALAQIRTQPDTGAAPSILHLFKGSNPPPMELSPWDKAFLESLYTTDQSSVLQVSIIQNRMFQQLAGR
jgi:hypothetical protein